MSVFLILKVFFHRLLSFTIFRDIRCSSHHGIFSFLKVFGFSFYPGILKFFDLCPFKHRNVFFSYKVFVVVLLCLIISSSLLYLSWILELLLDLIVDLGSLIISLLFFISFCYLFWDISLMLHSNSSIKFYFVYYILNIRMCSFSYFLTVSFLLYVVFILWMHYPLLYFFLSFLPLSFFFPPVRCLQWKGKICSYLYV